jgi:hypothetical protein
MGSQFSYFCCPEDLAEIERAVFQPLGGSLFTTEKRNASDVLVPVSSFSLSRERMGLETLFLYLEPPRELRSVVFTGPWLDSSRSHVIQVGRSYISQGKIGTARFWYEKRADGAFTEKPNEFLLWSQLVFKRTKGLLARRSYSAEGRSYTEWFGKNAWAEIQAGSLRVASSAA